MRYPKFRCLLIAVLAGTVTAHAQKDTTFWFAAPEVIQSTSYNFDRPIVLRITTYAAPATVVVTQPAGGGMPPQSVSIPANSTSSIDVTNWIDNIEEQAREYRS